MYPPGSVFPCPPPLRRRRGSSPCWRRRSRSLPWSKAEQQQRNAWLSRWLTRNAWSSETVLVLYFTANTFGWGFFRLLLNYLILWHLIMSAARGIFQSIAKSIFNENTASDTFRQSAIFKQTPLHLSSSYSDKPLHVNRTTQWDVTRLHNVVKWEGKQLLSCPDCNL